MGLTFLLYLKEQTPPCSTEKGNEVFIALRSFGEDARPRTLGWFPQNHTEPISWEERRVPASWTQQAGVNSQASGCSTANFSLRPPPRPRSSSSCPECRDTGHRHTPDAREP